MSSQQVNPFNMVLSAITEMLLQHPGFARDVKEKNRIRFDDPSNRDPLKSAVGAADLPEVSIGTETATANVMETSSTSSCRRVYTIMISTGDFRYTELLGSVEWYVWCALCDWKKILGGLTWKDKNFVKKANIASIANGLSDPKANRNIVGWSAVWRIEIEMHLSTSDLLNELKDPIGDNA